VRFSHSLSMVVRSCREEYACGGASDVRTDVMSIHSLEKPRTHWDSQAWNNGFCVSRLGSLRLES